MNKDNKALKLQINQVNKETFDEVALSVFRYQYQNNPLYQKFIKLLKVSPNDIRTIQQIPFLPIEFFKYHIIKTGEWNSQMVFSSSGTTKNLTSKHHIRSLEWYRDCALKVFEECYGSIQDYIVLALLPSYLERKGSSLVYMIEQFIVRSYNPQSGFFLYNTDELVQVLGDCLKFTQKKVLLIGVSYALLDFADNFPQKLDKILIMETGGMKGKRSEMTKEALHNTLKNAFNIDRIHSEYGMTELLSQAYSKGNGIFIPSAKMKVLIRETTDPFNILPFTKPGGINVIDLANIDTCSFIATDDLGTCNQDGTFRLHGRIDASDLRGCNMLLHDN
ncbi:MAG: acyl transferase [Saprospiraceae bacterium]|nr:acyl transferase [Saprospiraceae bacterium]